MYAAAQTVSGTILGTVTDSSGSVVPNAKVTILNEGTDPNHVVKPRFDKGIEPAERENGANSAIHANLVDRLSIRHIQL